jgi:hypothetical protein
MRRDFTDDWRVRAVTLSLAATTYVVALWWRP